MHGTVDDFDAGDQDIWFNPYRAPKTERAQGLVDGVLNQLQNYERIMEVRRRARTAKDQGTFEATVTAVITDLVHTHLANAPGGVVVTRSKRILGKPSRYRPAIYNATFSVILDRLALPEMAFVEQSKGHVYDFDRGGRKRTTIRPGVRLITEIEERGLTFADLTTTGDGEPIVLKTTPSDWWDGADLMEYEDTDAIQQYRREMVEINDWLEAAHLDFDQSVAPETRVDLSARRLRRIFTRTSFESGGRLFGGFWQALPKQVRREGVWVDGEPISSLDYSQMNPRVAYGLAKQSPPMQDVYCVPGFEDEHYRDGIKQFFNAMLFTTKPITRMPKGVRENFCEKVSAQQVAKAILTAHPALKFYEGRGHHIQFIESQIMVRLLLDLKAKGITALPVHDAVCVARSRVEETRAAMVEIFRAVTGGEVEVREEGR